MLMRKSPARIGSAWRWATFRAYESLGTVSPNAGLIARASGQVLLSFT
jgi:hypothetical protein